MAEPRRQQQEPQPQPQAQAPARHRLQRPKGIHSFIYASWQELETEGQQLVYL